MTALAWLAAFCSWVGHAFALTVALNWVYAFPIHRYVLNRTRLCVGGLVVAYPVAFVWLCGGDVERWWTGGVPQLVAGYAAFALAVGVLVLPVVTLIRAVRKPPRSLLRASSDVVDIAAKLGQMPYGNGKHAWLAKLPGNEIFTVDYTERELALPRLPAAWDGLTILHLTDLHYHGTPDRAYHRAVLAGAAERWGDCDLVCVTGDIVDSEHHHRWILPLLGGIRGREGKFAIVGNHDYWNEPCRVRRRLTRAGYVVVSNRWVTQTIRGVPAVVIGQEGPWFRPPPDMAGCPGGTFRLCLSHTPDYVGWAARHDVDLMLSGHVHGGQVRVPVLGSLFVPSWYSRRYDCGTFARGGTTLVVGRGLAGKEPLRWRCRPEVCRITLRVGIG